MSDKQWAPEPWKELRCGSDDESHAGIADAKGDSVEYSNANYWDSELTVLSEADSTRIIACVNASRGISQEVLERIANGRGFSDIIQGMMQQKSPDFKGHWTQQFEEDTDE